jgi:hypothetical protein
MLAAPQRHAQRMRGTVSWDPLEAGARSLMYDGICCSSWAVLIKESLFRLNMAQAHDVPEDITQSIPVPSDKIGYAWPGSLSEGALCVCTSNTHSFTAAGACRWVIGKEGSYIKQLEERSQAVVRISDSSSREYGREWKYVQLQGAPRAVDKAKSECLLMG